MPPSCAACCGKDTTSEVMVAKPGHRLHASDVSCTQLALFPQSHCQHLASKCILRPYAQAFVVIQYSLLQFSLQSNTKKIMPLNS